MFFTLFYTSLTTSHLTLSTFDPSSTSYPSVTPCNPSLTASYPFLTTSCLSLTTSYPSLAFRQHLRRSWQHLIFLNNILSVLDNILSVLNNILSVLDNILSVPVFRLISDKTPFYLWGVPKGFDDLLNPLGNQGSNPNTDSPRLELEFEKGTSRKIFYIFKRKLSLSLNKWTLKYSILLPIFLFDDKLIFFC